MSFRDTRNGEVLKGYTKEELIDTVCEQSDEIADLLTALANKESEVGRLRDELSSTIETTQNMIDKNADLNAKLEKVEARLKPIEDVCSKPLPFYPCSKPAIKKHCEYWQAIKQATEGHTPERCPVENIFSGKVDWGVDLAPLRAFVEKWAGKRLVTQDHLVEQLQDLSMGGFIKPLLAQRAAAVIQEYDQFASEAWTAVCKAAGE